MARRAKAKGSKSKSKGCSNAGKYPNVSPGLFCGPSGGACAGTYPVNTPGRARSAISYSRFAPRPEGIKSCVKKIAAAHGWLRPDGTIKIK
jgi:hypothetical protein